MAQIIVKVLTDKTAFDASTVSIEKRIQALNAQKIQITVDKSGLDAVDKQLLSVWNNQATAKIKLAQASIAKSNASAKEAQATAKVAAEEIKLKAKLEETAQITAKASLETAKLATEREKTAQSTQKATVATARAAAEASKLASAQEKTTQTANAVSTAQEKTAQSIQATYQAEQKSYQTANQRDIAYQKTIQSTNHLTEAQIKSADASKKQTQGIKNTGDAAKKTGDTFLSSAAKMARWMLIGNVVSAVKRSFTDALKEMKAVDDELVTVRKVTGATTEELEKLTKQAYEMGSAYGVAASEFMSSVAAFSKAGYGELSSSLAELAIKTQLVGDMDAKTAQQMLLSVDAAYKYNGSVTELMKVLDGMNEIDNNFATSMEKIAEGLGKVAPVAAMAHVGIDELSAAIGTITAITQRSGTEAATALRAIILNIMGDTTTEIEDGTKATAESINSLTQLLIKYAPEAVAAAEATGQLINPMEAIGAMAKAYKEGLMTEADMAQMAIALGGKLRTTQLVSLLNGWDDVYQKMLEVYGLAAGSANKEVENAMDSWTRKSKQLSNAWTEFISKTVDSKSIKNFLDAITWLIKGMDNLGTAIGIVGGAFAAVKMSSWITTITNVFSATKYLGGGFKNLVAVLQNYKGASASAQKTGQSLNDTLKNGGASANFGALGISALITVVSALVIAYNTWKRAQEETLSKAAKNAEELYGNYKSLSDLVDKYNALSEKQDWGNEEREEAKTIQEQIVELVGDEAKALDLVNGALDDQKQKLADISLEYAKSIQGDLDATVQSAENALVNLSRAVNPFNQENLIQGGSRATNAFLREYIADLKYIAEVGNSVYGLIGIETADDAQGAIDELKALRDAYDSAGFGSTAAFDQIQKRINDLTDYLDDYSSALTAALKNDAFIEIKEQVKTFSVDSKESLDSLVETIIATTGATGQYAILIKQLAYELFPAYTDAVDDANKADAERENEHKKAISTARDNIAMLREAQEQMKESGQISDALHQMLITAYGDEAPIMYDTATGYYVVTGAIDECIESEQELLLLLGVITQEAVEKTKAIDDAKIAYDGLSAALTEQNKNGEITKQTYEDLTKLLGAETVAAMILEKSIVKTSDGYFLTDTAVKAVTDAMDENQETLAGLGVTYGAQATEIIGYAEAVSDAMVAYDGLSSALKEQSENGAITQKTYEQLSALLGETAFNALIASGSITIMGDGYYLAEDAVDAVTAAMDENQETLAGLGVTYGAQKSSVKDWNETVGDAKEKIELLKKATEEYNDTGYVSKKTGDRLVELYGDTESWLQKDGDAYRIVIDNVEDLTDAQKELLKQWGIIVDTENPLKQLIYDAISLQDELKGASDAIERFNKSLEGGEKGDLFAQYADVYKRVMALYEKGYYGSTEYQAGVLTLLDSKTLASIGYDYVEAGKILNSKIWKAMMGEEGDDKGAQFANYMAKNMSVVTGDNGEVIATFKKVGKEIQYQINDWEGLAEATGMNADALMAWFDATDIYGQESLNSLSQVRTALEAMDTSIVKVNGNIKTINFSALTDKLVEMGLDETQYVNFIKTLQSMSDVNLEGVSDDLLDAYNAAKDLNEEAEQENKIELDSSDYDTAQKKNDDLQDSVNDLTSKTYRVKVQYTTSTLGVGAGASGLFKLASGIRNFRGGSALVNDGEPVNGSSAELIVDRGRAAIVNDGKPAVVTLSHGATILTAKETQESGALNGGIPAFASGSGTLPVGLGSNRPTGTHGSGIGLGLGSSRPTGSVPVTSTSSSSSSSSSATLPTADDYWAIVQSYIEYGLRLAQHEIDVQQSLLDELSDQMEDALDPINDEIEAQERASAALDRQIRTLERAQSAALKPIQQQIDALDTASTALERQIRDIERARDAALKPLDDEIEALEDAQNIQDQELDLAEKQLAVEEARAALQNAQNDRSVRVWNAEAGQWEHVANQENVDNAQQALTDAEEALADFIEEMQIDALRAQRDELEAEYNSQIELLDNQNDELEYQIDLLQDNYDDIQDSYDDQIELLDEQQELIADNIDALEQQQEAIQDQYETLMEPIQAHMDALQAEYDAYQQQWDAIQLAMSAPTESITNALNQLANSGIPAFADSVSAVQSLLSTLATALGVSNISEGYGGRTGYASRISSGAVLRRGSTGNDVVLLQKALIAAGYSVGNSGADGIFGSNTFAAVQAYQAANGLTADGVAGALTIGNLAARGFDHGGIMRGIGPAIKATERDEIVLDPETTAAILNPQTNAQLSNFMSSFGIMTGAAKALPNSDLNKIVSGAVENNNGDTYYVNGVQIGAEQAETWTFAQTMEHVGIHVRKR